MRGETPNCLAHRRSGSARPHTASFPACRTDRRPPRSRRHRGGSRPNDRRHHRSRGHSPRSASRPAHTFSSTALRHILRGKVRKLSKGPSHHIAGPNLRGNAALPDCIRQDTHPHHIRQGSSAPGSMPLKHRSTEAGFPRSSSFRARIHPRSFPPCRERGRLRKSSMLLRHRRPATHSPSNAYRLPRTRPHTSRPRKRTCNPPRRPSHRPHSAEPDPRRTALRRARNFRHSGLPHKRRDKTRRFSKHPPRSFARLPPSSAWPPPRSLQHRRLPHSRMDTPLPPAPTLLPRSVPPVGLRTAFPLARTPPCRHRPRRRRGRVRGSPRCPTHRSAAPPAPSSLPLPADIRLLSRAAPHLPPRRPAPRKPPPIPTRAFSSPSSMPPLRGLPSRPGRSAGRESARPLARRVGWWGNMGMRAAGRRSQTPVSARLPSRRQIAERTGCLPVRDEGRSSDLRACGLNATGLLSAASQPEGQCFWRRSFSLTAAGQSRISTGFPLSALPGGRAPSSGPALATDARSCQQRGSGPQPSARDAPPRKARRLSILTFSDYSCRQISAAFRKLHRFVRYWIQ